MRFPGPTDVPEEHQDTLRRARRIERISIAYWISLIVILYFTLGQSQAMKAAWVEDILGMVPPIAWLVADRYRNREPDRRFAFGRHRSITIAYLIASVALLGLGLFILYDSVERLLVGTHPPIGMVEIFDRQIWLGWLMIAALLYGLFPSLILGRIKQKLAEPLHDKVLYADARMNRADWLTASAAIVGIVGIGLGLWWMDAVAAIAISADIVADGQRFLRASFGDLMDEQPESVDESGLDPVIDAVKREVAGADWVAGGAVRLREDGHLVTGEVWVVPRASEVATERIEDLVARLEDLDWRLRGLAVMPVTDLRGVPEGLEIHDPT